MPVRMISFYNASGLGLPERDYYTRTDAKSVEQRRQYVEHVHKIFVLAGEPDAEAAKDADTVLGHRDTAGQGVPHRDRTARPAKSQPSDGTWPVFEKELTHFSLAEYAAAAHAPAKGRMNETEPKFFAEFDTLLADTPLEQIKTYLRWHLLHAYAGHQPA